MKNMQIFAPLLSAFCATPLEQNALLLCDVNLKLILNFNRDKCVCTCKRCKVVPICHSFYNF